MKQEIVMNLADKLVNRIQMIIEDSSGKELHLVPELIGSLILLNEFSSSKDQCSPE